MNKTYNIFISHSWAYSSDYDRLVQILNNRLYFSYNNASTQVSSVVRINANVLVNWNTESIIQAIRDYSI